MISVMCYLMPLSHGTSYFNKILDTSIKFLEDFFLTSGQCHNCKQNLESRSTQSFLRSTAYVLASIPDIKGVGRLYQTSVITAAWIWLITLLALYCFVHLGQENT